jgi:CrcB protein
VTGEAPRPSAILEVALGGAIGTAARYALGRLAPVAPRTFPTTTLLVNLSGAFLLGLLIMVLAHHRPDDVRLRALLGVGVLGGFTTFSTFAVETVQLLRAHCGGIALAYVAASIGGGLVAARLGARVWRGPLPAEGES